MLVVKKKHQYMYHIALSSSYACFLIVFTIRVSSRNFFIWGGSGRGTFMYLWFLDEVTWYVLQH